MSNGLFETNYFLNQYQGNYRRRNPPYKWRAFLKVILRFRQSGRLLDVGCAYGLFLLEAQRYFVCSGSDISHHALEEARKILPPEVNLFPGALGSLSSDRPYDVITCFDVLEHIPDLEIAWENLERLLRPGGLLVLTVPVYDGPLGWLVNRLDTDPTHVHRRERAFWLEQVGRRFSIRDVLGVWRFFFLKRFYLNWVSRPARHLATAILVVAEKPS
ncbi:MAG: class I SAM-dependent methyltransferase [Anaerolineales bacterium]|nr:class I SAM-dependent methyltransferase [Anaerolineales bacterium]MDW8227412.1 class I SAM-dependent methyltransferase [Anaerolineales bacterium]